MIISIASGTGIKTACCINKYDLNLKISDQITEWCRQKSIPLIGKIPFDEEVTKAMLHGVPVSEYGNCTSAERFKEIWHETQQLLNS